MRERKSETTDDGENNRSARQTFVCAKNTDEKDEDMTRGGDTSHKEYEGQSQTESGRLSSSYDENSETETIETHNVETDKKNQHIRRTQDLQSGEDDDLNQTIEASIMEASRVSAIVDETTRRNRCETEASDLHRARVASLTPAPSSERVASLIPDSSSSDLSSAGSSEWTDTENTESGASRHYNEHTDADDAEKLTVKPNAWEKNLFHLNSHSDEMN